MRLPALLAVTLTSLSSGPVTAASAPLRLPGVTSFADLAILTLDAPVVVHAKITKATALPTRDTPGLAADTVRMHVDAALTDAILAPDRVPAAIDYLADVAAAAPGKAPALKGADVLLFLRTSGTQFQLSNAHGQIGWSAAAEATVRRIIADARSGSVPVITGIGNAFRVPGNVPGEAESQFFLNTADGKPVSLVVLSRPGEPQRLSLALGDVIDEAAESIPHDTLRWYRLACFLPQALPATIEADADLTADYAFVLKSLGPCGRTLP